MRLSHHPVFIKEDLHSPLKESMGFLYHSLPYAALIRFLKSERRKTIEYSLIFSFFKLIL